MADGADGKAQVAREVCAAAAAFTSCPHRRRSPRRSPFVDWYLVLAVGEAASEDAVQRRYRHLALQLHPDKNGHPKAEAAFKIVSEAHVCLTDKARRRAFDAERSTAICAACYERARGAPASSRHRTGATEKRTLTASDQQEQQARGGSVAKPSPRAPAAAPTQALREVQNRLRHECRVIYDCLRANGGGGNRSPSSTRPTGSASPATRTSARRPAHGGWGRSRFPARMRRIRVGAGGAPSRRCTRSERHRSAPCVIGDGFGTSLCKCRPLN